MKVPDSPPDVFAALDTETRNQLVLRGVLEGRFLSVDTKGRYLHWDDQKHRQPPPGYSHSQWWGLTKVARNSVGRKLPFVSTAGTPATYVLTDLMSQMLMDIDRRCGGSIGSPSNLDGADRDRLLVSSLQEEAITSSQLEGASTSRKIAKQMLQENRRPVTLSEKMIHNNFAAMQYIQQDHHSPLSVEEICQIHQVITSGVLEDPNDEGRPQLPEDKRVSIYWQTNGVDQEIYRPPPAELLPARLETLCDFANANEPENGFLHPVLRALTIHFWIGYDHPFADGNGRLARTLFYRSMLGSGYWLAEFLSISSILRKRPAKYARSYLLCETDALDLTYFFMDQLEIIKRALDALDTYIARKRSDLEAVSSLLGGRRDLNHRQIALLSGALRNPGAEYTIASHRAIHSIVYESARQDLLELSETGLLERFKAGRAFVFRSPLDLNKRLKPKQVIGATED
jgi:Fic family protein